MRHPPPHPEHESLRQVLGSLRTAFLAVAVFSLAINLLMLSVPLYMLQLFDRVLATRNVDTLMALTLIAVLAIVVMGCLEAVRSLLMIRCGTGIERQLSPEVLHSSANAARRGEAGRSPSAQALRDLASVRNYLGGPAVMAIFDAPFTPLFLSVVFIIHPVLGWIALGGAIILLLLAFANELATRAPVQQSNLASAHALNEADGALRNFDVIEAMGMMGALVERWRVTNDRSLVSYELASDRAGKISATARVVRLLLQVAMLGAGAWLAMSDVISGGAMIAASIIAARALAPIEQSISGWKLLVGAQQAFTRVRALLQNEFQPLDGITLPPPKGRLAVRGLIHIPPGATEPVLRDISFELLPGSSLGVIGPSAAGKTTLVRHLVGSLAPTRGNVRLDGADLTRWLAADRGRWVGYLPQDVELFTGTVRDNIARLGDADDAEVVAAAQLAGAHEAILSLPDGYGTLLHASVARLSGGQRQRIALARAVFGDPKLVILDEPNANLDGEGEIALLKAVAELKRRGTTVVMVAHRPSLMSSMDRLLALRAGQVAALGDRETVLKKLAAPQGIVKTKTKMSGKPVGT